MTTFTKARILQPFLILSYACSLTVPFVDNPVPPVLYVGAVALAAWYLRCPECKTTIFYCSPKKEGFLGKVPLLLAPPSEKCEKCGHVFRDRGR
jgi:hypothetical protein